MYAIIKLGNQQFKVQPDQVFVSQKTGQEVGSQFDTAPLLYTDGSNIQVGNPELSDLKVKLEVVEDFKGTKIRGFKYKKRKNYHKSWGHRQELQKLRVISIS